MIDKIDIEKNLVKLNADIIDIKARLQALENSFFGFYNAENEESAAKEFRQMFFDFYYENLKENINELPAGSVKELTLSLLLPKEK